MPLNVWEGVESEERNGGEGYLLHGGDVGVDADDVVFEMIEYHDCDCYGDGSYVVKSGVKSTGQWNFTGSYCLSYKCTRCLIKTSSNHVKHDHYIHQNALS